MIGLDSCVVATVSSVIPAHSSCYFVHVVEIYLLHPWPEPRRLARPKPALHETTRGLLDFPIAMRVMAQNEPVARDANSASMQQYWWFLWRLWWSIRRRTEAWSAGLYQGTPLEFGRLCRTLLTVWAVFSLFGARSGRHFVDINRGSEHTDQREASHNNVLKSPPRRALTWAFRIFRMRGFRV